MEQELKKENEMAISDRGASEPADGVSTPGQSYVWTYALLAFLLAGGIMLAGLIPSDNQRLQDPAVQTTPAPVKTTP